MKLPRTTNHSLVGIVLLLATSNASADSNFDEIVVTSKRQGVAAADHIGNIARVSEDAIRESQHVHVNELMVKVPGVWIARGSGQESLPSIRSPVLTGPGSCGAFLVLENGIPTRPNGFCNVNQLFELPTELATGVEVIRGPGNALYGSNALHGIINVLTPAAGNSSANSLAIEAGANNFLRLRARLSGPPEKPFQASFVVADDGGFRDRDGKKDVTFYFRIYFPASLGDFVWEDLNGNGDADFADLAEGRTGA